MVRTWIYIFAAVLGIVAAACSDDSPNTPETNDPPNPIEIIDDNKSSSSDKDSLEVFFRSTKTKIFFSNHVEIKSSSSVTPTSSSKAVKSSSSKNEKSSSSISSSSAKSSSSSSAIPKSSAALRFYDCDQYDCVTTEFLNPEVSYGELLDKRDNKVYRTIVISNHVWTAQNMNFKTETDSTSKSWCFDNDSKNCEKYGRIYSWNAAKKVCPEGWHLPTSEEWKELLSDHACDSELLDDGTWAYDCSGYKLKSTETWDEKVERQNALGFSVIAAGMSFENTPIALGETAFFWSATDTLSFYAFAALFMNEESSVLYGATEKNYGLSVPCIKGFAE